MGQRGRAPEPARLRILKGETRPSQLNGAPKPQDPPCKPGGMTPEGAAVWDRVMAAITPTAHIGEAHVDTLRAYCEVTARLFAYVDPSSREWRDLATSHRQLARELCLTPATGANLSVRAPTADPRARFLRAG